MERLPVTRRPERKRQSEGAFGKGLSHHLQSRAGPEVWPGPCFRVGTPLGKHSLRQPRGGPSVSAGVPTRASQASGTNYLSENHEEC